MTYPKLFLSVLVWVAAAAHLCAWGVEGHKALAELARTRLSSAARTQVVSLLGNDDLADVADWADEVRDAGRHRGPLVGDPEARAFVKAFPKNPSWHFVDQPLGTKAYTDNGKFSREDDVVHIINRCIAVLEGKSSRFTPSQALRLLIHFVGDIHQPLHAGTGYFDLSDPAAPKLVTDPAEVDPKTGDHGGNSLYFSKSQELHAFWDGTLVQKLDGKDYRKLAASLEDKSPERWKTSGDYHRWAETWATESVRVAEGAYRGITFERAELNQRHDLERIEIKLAPSYAWTNEPVVADQIAKAGLRLADLLNHLQWK